MALIGNEGFGKFVCSKDTDTLCYFLALNMSDYKVCLFDYTNTGNINFTEPSNTNYHLTSLTPISGENIIVTGYDTTTGNNKFILYCSNHTSTSVNWSVETNVTGKRRDLCCIRKIALQIA